MVTSSYVRTDILLSNLLGRIMSLEAAAFCLTNVEIQVLNTLANYEPVSAELFQNQQVLVSLEQKGYIEKVHQEVANIDRYRLTINGRIKQRSLDHIAL